MNKAFLIGNLTRDPELTETSGGIKVCRFTIAVNRNRTNADGERLTDFFNCVAWRSTAESVSKYTHKGDKVAVNGSIELRNYEDSAGVKRTAIDVIAQEVEFLNTKKAEDKPAQTDGRKQLQPCDDDSDIPF